MGRGMATEQRDRLLFPDTRHAVRLRFDSTALSLRP